MCESLGSRNTLSDEKNCIFNKKAYFILDFFLNYKMVANAERRGDITT